MSNIRKAHSVEIIDRRLRSYAAADSIDEMELVGLYDELARVERKWREKAEERSAGRTPGGRAVRPLANSAEMNQRFERLTQLIRAALRRPGAGGPERQFLQQIANSLEVRRPLPEG